MLYSRIKDNFLQVFFVEIKCLFNDNTKKAPWILY